MFLTGAYIYSIVHLYIAQMQLPNENIETYKEQTK